MRTEGAERGALEGKVALMQKPIMGCIYFIKLLCETGQEILIKFGSIRIFSDQRLKGVVP
jgi:hypothetical protein